MINKIGRKLFGSKNDRELRRMGKTVEKINQLEADYEKLSETELRDLTTKFRERHQAGESLDSMLPEAFAAVREASKRTLGLRHYDVQMLGGMVLHDGKIAEMRTGEGKTLVATLAAYLNAISGKGVHLITVNDYLARRDAHWMGPIYDYLGVSLGVIQSSGGLGADNASFHYDASGESDMENFKYLHSCSRRQAYGADITYGTNNEFGFDYLRDNMVLSLEAKSQRGVNFAIVDEVDSILIDEARTPLVISGPAEDSSQLYIQMNKFVPQLKAAPEPELLEESELEEELDEELEPDMEAEEFSMEALEEDLGDFIIDEKVNSVELTEQGHQKIEEMMISEGLLEEGDNLYAAKNLMLLHHVQTALRAHQLFHRDAEYIVQDGQIVLIDEHTGRKMLGRRLAEGLHQALEAKEGLKVQNESQTLASTTFQNYFRLYAKLSGMTGTADTEAVEFNEIYSLQVVVLPTNQSIRRNDRNDLIYMTQDEKYEAVIEDIEECREKSAPVLVGTITIETSEKVSTMLDKAGIPHKVLNAKFHEQEAEIVSKAGMPGAVTIATNMAGRGTDIVLGGNLEMELAALEDPSPEKVEQVKADWKKRNQQVLDVDGLHIIGTERHESRRIDNQLRGRAGRQGDPGVSRFYLSMEDNLMRLFASDRVRKIMQAIGLERGEAIEHKMVTNSIEKAQRKVEGRNFDIRKQLLEFDDIANDQRTVIYHQRNQLLEMDDISEIIDDMRVEAIDNSVAKFMPPESVEEEWDAPGLVKYMMTEFGAEYPIKQWLQDDKTLNDIGVRDRIAESMRTLYIKKVSALPDHITRRLERDVMLQIMDRQWKQHLATMDALRSGINLRGYGGKNPKHEYKRESFNLFQDLLESVKFETIRLLTRIELADPEEVEELEKQRDEREQKMKESMLLRHDRLAANFGGEKAGSPEENAARKEAARPQTPFVRDEKKIGRNEPCHCGSGKKYKQCHGKLS